jgi:ketosteroid isomerase-like protein
LREPLYDRVVTEQERVLRAFYDAFNDGDLEGSAVQFAEQCKYEFVACGSAGTQWTRAEVLEGLQNWRAAFQDGRVEPTDVVVSGTTVVVEWDSRGTWTGAPIRGKQPNGQRFEACSALPAVRRPGKGA